MLELTGAGEVVVTLEDKVSEPVVALVVAPEHEVKDVDLVDETVETESVPIVELDVTGLLSGALLNDDRTDDEVTIVCPDVEDEASIDVDRGAPPVI